MNKLVLLSLFMVAFFISIRAEATVCIGYFSNSSVQAFNQWGNLGDNFSTVDMKGKVSWPSGSSMAYYKSPNKIPMGNWATYSIALPKKISIGDVLVDVKVEGNKIYYDTPLNHNYTAWLVDTVSEGCRSLPPGWNQISGVDITSGSLIISLKGSGLPSGYYKIQLPYTLAWGTDPNQSESERLKGTWAEIDPANSTGFFDLSFEVKNKCDISGQNMNFDYGTLMPNEIHGNKKSKKLQLNCTSSEDVSLLLLAPTIDLNNGVNAKIKLKDMNNNEIKSVSVERNIPAEFVVESELEVVSNLTEGKFSGGTVLSIFYD